MTDASDRMEKVKARLRFESDKSPSFYHVVKFIGPTEYGFHQGCVEPCVAHMGYRRTAEQANVLARRYAEEDSQWTYYVIPQDRFFLFPPTAEDPMKVQEAINRGEDKIPYDVNEYLDMYAKYYDTLADQIQQKKRAAREHSTAAGNEARRKRMALERGEDSSAEEVAADGEAGEAGEVGDAGEAGEAKEGVQESKGEDATEGAEGLGEVEVAEEVADSTKLTVRSRTMNEETGELNVELEQSMKENKEFSEVTPKPAIRQYRIAREQDLTEVKPNPYTIVTCVYPFAQYRPEEVPQIMLRFEGCQSKPDGSDLSSEIYAARYHELFHVSIMQDECFHPLPIQIMNTEVLHGDSESSPFIEAHKYYLNAKTCGAVSNTIA